MVKQKKNSDFFYKIVVSLLYLDPRVKTKAVLTTLVPFQCQPPICNYVCKKHDLRIFLV
jgi:hypothetical protein